MKKQKPVIKPTRATKRVLLVLLTDLPGLSGYPIMRAAALGSGSVYPVLARLEREGWVAAEWEEGKPRGLRRRFYRLTPEGRRNALSLLGLGLLERQRQA